MGINYTAAATHDEIVELFRIAASQNAPVSTSMSAMQDEGTATGLVGIEEVIAAAASTGAPLHIVHITSMGLKNTPVDRRNQRRAKAGLDVTTECYPYIAGSTQLESAIFDPGWQERQGITFKDFSGAPPANASPRKLSTNIASKAATWSSFPFPRKPPAPLSPIPRS